MTSLRPNLVKRIQRLPKPKNVADALQPIFEAISNSIHSTQEKFGKDVSLSGKVIVIVEVKRTKENVSVTVEDNGVGLNAKNWDAFTTTDTDNKITIGGKGVGRLLWLDCFEDIQIHSVFVEDGKPTQRSFNFVLTQQDQIKNSVLENLNEIVPSSFHVNFRGLRENGYLEKFPGRGQIIFQHITSHFLPTFIGDRCPKIIVHVGDETREYPEAINEIVHRMNEDILLETEEFGSMKLTLMECDKVASSDLKGTHFVHFIAHDRTVHSQSIDGKLGLKNFGDGKDRVFHAVLTGDFLNDNVNQERTAFQFEDVVIEKIINDVCYVHIEDFLKEPLAELKNKQKTKIKEITNTYPSVAFGNPEELQNKVPSGELKEDAIYGHLSRERFRRDEKQAEKIRLVLTRLKEGSVNVDEFSETIIEATQALEDTEQKSLAEYIVRRKVVLDFIELLLQKVRDDNRDSSYQREDVLHSFICPLRIQSINDNEARVEASSSHDLWIIDERLTFAQYFSSDVEFNKLTQNAQSGERPDVLIFDYVHGLKQKDDPSKVLLIEFKRPGRTNYSDSENPQHQIERYVRQLQTGSLADVKGRPIKLDKNTIFHCFIVADIIGKLDDWTFSWQQTADGKGRIYRPDNGFNGYIELMGWDDLLEDARVRNQAFFDRAGISGNSYFSAD